MSRIAFGYTEGLTRFLFFIRQHLGFSCITYVLGGEAYRYRSTYANRIRIGGNYPVAVPLDNLEVNDRNMRVSRVIISTRLDANRRVRFSQSSSVSV